MNLKQIIFSTKKEKRFYGLENIDNDNFMAGVFDEIEEEIKRNSKDKELFEELIGDETVRI
jgi:hypothetical protein